MSGKRRNIIHRHARLKSGAGVHTDKRNHNWKEDTDMRMTLKEFREEHGIENGTDMKVALEDWAIDSVVPALCHDGCEVEPDGECEHGNPSILIRLGLI
jgi:hypothetical protein